MKQCQNLNIPYGVYYYSLATEAAQAKKEAEYVNHLLDGRVPELGVFIDLEDETFQGALTNDQLTIVATTFLDNIQNQNKKGIYANHHWWTTKLTDKKLDSYIKWKARYNDTPVLEEEYHILQYSETGQIRGINGNVDLNMTINKYW
ncbi:MAG TPA: GH25 family lysozyme [Thomasclavelia ramosa]|nr:GH25 family lysozyme [Thomasclavelia ramosa]